MGLSNDVTELMMSPAASRTPELVLSALRGASLTQGQGAQQLDQTGRNLARAPPGAVPPPLASVHVSRFACKHRDSGVTELGKTEFEDWWGVGGE